MLEIFDEHQDTDVGAPVRMTVKANFNLLTPHAQIANDPRRLSSCKNVAKPRATRIEF